jgi:hypothetical protein
VWEDSDLVECNDLIGGNKNYVRPDEDGEGGRSREFRIPQHVLSRFAELSGGSRRWWLHTPEPQRTSQPSPMTTDLSENGNRFPVLVDKALRVLAAADHRLRVEPIKKAIRMLAQQNGITARAQKAGLQLQLEVIERQAEKVENGVAHLQNAYTPTFGGRIMFKNGGPQGMLGAVKARAYDIGGLFNYDIRSCHTTGLKQVADKLAAVGVNIDVSPWEEYQGKYKIANQTGLPVVLVKIVEHAIKYGAFLPVSIAQAQKVFEDSRIEPEKDLKLVTAAKRYTEDPNEALGKLHEVFGDMRRVVKSISKALLNEYWDAHKQPGGPAGYCIKNACGVTFRPSDYPEGHKRETKVMAWMLQGLEAAFIHSVTILSAQSGHFSAIANEHDGLITDGEIPGIKEEGMSEVVEIARLMSGFHRAELVEKPHADEEEIDEVYGQPEEEPQVHAPPQTEAAERAVERYLEKRRGRSKPVPERYERESRRLAKFYAQREIPQLTAKDVERLKSGGEQEGEPDHPTWEESDEGSRPDGRQTRRRTSPPRDLDSLCSE